jgi:hypothetical protein
MQAAGQWLLGSKKRAEKTRIFQYKCDKCGATLRIAEKEQKGAKQTEAPQPQQQVTNSH